MEDYYLLEAFRWLLETDLESEFYDALIQGYTIQIMHGDGGALDLLFKDPVTTTIYPPEMVPLSLE